MILYRKFLFLLLTFSAYASLAYSQLQLDEPENTHWKFDIPRNNIKPGDVVELVFSADVNKGWALYSSDFKADIGPLPTEFIFNTHESYQLVGKVVPQNPLKKKDKTWDVDYTYFNNKAVFKQKVKILKKDFTITGSIKGLTCSETDGLCVPFSKTFTF